MAEMTKEEAIKIVKYYRDLPIRKDDKKALDMAIKALEQQPCEDTISRQAVLDVWHTSYSDNREENEEIQYKKIAFELPSVNPQEPKTGHWVEENINEYSRKVVCSECGCPPPFEHISNGDVYSANGHGVFNKTKYCPSCGAKMESEEV